MLSVRAARAWGATVTSLTVLTALTGAVVLLPAGAAHAEARTVQGGRLDWGIKSSFQSYVTGPIAQGSWSLEGGAATVGGSQFRFHSATGSYDPATGAFRAGFQGGVHFVGHRTASGTYQLDLTISRPTVRITGGTGTLYADMVSKEKDSGKVSRSSQVPLASLDLSGVAMRGGSSPVALSGVPARLTARGATAFAGYYTAGTALDPVSLSADVVAPAGAGGTSRPPAPKESRAGGKGGAPDKPGAIADAAVDWGVRRTFREYVTGPVAHGRWTLTGGAEDGGAVFRFPKGTGTLRDGTLTASFSGAVRFTGDDGLDLTLGAPRVDVRDGEGTLSADVRDPDGTARHTPLVTFHAGPLTPKKGVATVTEAPATLTAEGARVFSGLYRAGTAMDPVSLAVALDDDARLPALPDLGSGADSPSPAPSAPSASALAAPAGSGTADGSSSPALPVAGLLGGAGAVVAGGLALVLLRRRRARAASGTPRD